MPLVPSRPFPNVFPVGANYNHIFKPRQFSDMSLIAATAADRRIYSHSSQLRNWHVNYAVGTSIPVKVVVYSPYSRRWHTFGDSAGTTTTLWTISGTTWVSFGGPLQTGDGFVAKCAATNLASDILFGYGRTSASTGKFLRSTNGGTTFGGTVAAFPTSNTQSGQAIAWCQALGRWIAVVGANPAGTLLTGGTFSTTQALLATSWTQGSGRSPQFLMVRNRPSPIILGTTIDGQTTMYLRSVDGVNWTEETFPTNLSGGFQGCFHAEDGYFYVPASTSLYRSSTGLTGSWSNLGAFGGSHIASYGPFILRGNATYSPDGGGTWFRCFEFENVDLLVSTQAGVGAVFARTTGGDHYVSFLGGV